MSPYSRSPQVRVVETQPPSLPAQTEAPPPRLGSRAWIAIVVIAIAAAGVWQRTRIRIVKPAPAPVRTAKVRKTPVERTLRVPGITTAEIFSAMMAPNLSGSRAVMGHSQEFTLTLETLAKPGSFVKKGETVAQFDSQYMKNRLDDFRSLVVQHEFNLRRLKAILDERRVSYEQQIHVAKGRMDKAELDVKKAPVLSFIRAESLRLLYNEARDRYNELRNSERHYNTSEESAVRWSELDLKEAKLEYERANRNLNRMIAKAPNDGLVVMLTTRRGSEMAPIEEGDELRFGQPYMQIVDMRGIVVNANVNQVDAEQLRGGMEARVHFEAYPDLELPAQVVNVSAMTRQGGWRANYVRSVPVRLKLEQQDPRVIPNLTTSVDLVLERAEAAPSVPLECLFRDETKEEPYVFVQTPAGWEKRDVELGLANFVEAQVRTGLTGGEVLATERPH